MRATMDRTSSSEISCPSCPAQVDERASASSSTDGLVCTDCRRNRRLGAAGAAASGAGPRSSSGRSAAGGTGTGTVGAGRRMMDGSEVDGTVGVCAPTAPTPPDNTSSRTARPRTQDTPGNSSCIWLPTFGLPRLHTQATRDSDRGYSCHRRAHSQDLLQSYQLDKGPITFVFIQGLTRRYRGAVRPDSSPPVGTYPSPGPPTPVRPVGSPP